MEEQEATTIPPSEDNIEMPDGLEPVSPESNTPSPAVKIKTDSNDPTLKICDVNKENSLEHIDADSASAIEAVVPEQISTEGLGIDDVPDAAAADEGCGDVAVLNNLQNNFEKDFIEDSKETNEAPIGTADNKLDEKDNIEDEKVVENNLTSDSEKLNNLDDARNDDNDSLKDKSDSKVNEVSLSDASELRNDNECDAAEKEAPASTEDSSGEVKQNGPEEGPQDEKAGNDEDDECERKDLDLETSLDQDKDDRGNPQFEDAPEHAPNDSHDLNASQSLDPFDELLKGHPDEPATDALASTCSRKEFNLDNDDMDASGIDESAILDDDHADDTLVEDSIVADLNEGQGADEEICLLPDTEREISEADKLKALAATKTKDSEKAPAAGNLDSATPDSTNKDIDVDVTDNIAKMKGEMSNDIIEKDDSADTAAVDGEQNNDCETAAGDDHAGEAADGDKEKDMDDEEIIITEGGLKEGVIQEIDEIDETCMQCSQSKKCHYRLMQETETKHLCDADCLKLFQEAAPEKFTLEAKKYFVKEINATEATCVQCHQAKQCYYEIHDRSELNHVCITACLDALIGENRDNYTVSRKKKYIQEINEKEVICHGCSQTKSCKYSVSTDGVLKHLCDIDCVKILQDLLPNIFKIRKRRTVKVKDAPLLKLKVISNATDKYLDEGHRVVAKTPEQVAAARADRDSSFFRKCAHCFKPYLGNDKNLSWETMDFCNESCLGKYQNENGSNCANCKNDVSITSLGKYCVRFGYDIRQFCCSGCLEEFKKGLKICCYCQRDISVDYEGFLAPVGDKGQFKDFCSQFCVEKFDQMSKNPVPPPVWAQCAVCSKEKLTQLEVAINDKNNLRLCSEPCFAAFKYVNHILPDQCRWCNKYFERKSAESYTIYTDAATHCFCSKACMNVYISNSRIIVPCNWCKVKKYNFDMIKRTLDSGQSMMMCSLNCLTLYQISLNASSLRIRCDQCKRNSQAQYHLTMSDATVRNFCTYQCVMSFQGQYSKAPLMVAGDAHSKQAVPTGAPRRTLTSQRNNAKNQSMKMMDQRSGMPVIASVQSLATAPPPPVPHASAHGTRAKSKRTAAKPAKHIERPVTPPPVIPPKPPTPPPPPPPKIFNHIVIKPAPPKEMRNVCTLTKPLMVTKGVSCRPHLCTKDSQTDSHLERRILIPIPVPIYIPVPVAMYSLPFPVPVPIPIPIPIPIFIPTTRNSATGIMKEIKKIHEKMPTDPFEAELLMMAEMVAGEKKKCESDSESEEENGVDDGFSPDGMDAGNSGFGEDVLQMALKMATEYEEPAVDLESAMTASTITPSSHPPMAATGLDENNPMHHHQLMMLEQQRATAAAAAAAAAGGRKRGARGPPTPAPLSVGTRSSKRSRRAPDPTPSHHHSAPDPPREPQEKPDANMCLKYTFGVNAWKQWVMTKNAEMEKSTVRRKPFKSEILQLTADELNYSLCLFVKEVRKPNGSEYAPDTIYYLVLGIQQYLFENGRIDNIFTDSYYEKFTECLDEVARKFSVLYNDSQYIVTRVEEEHLWESKQLGAHSPHVLLSTLMFFNTKHFNLVTVEEHMQLSFSHIMKHWKRNPNQPGAAKIPGSRNVLLRFYPPQSALEANSRKKKVYEQQENEENPLRCPVKLYEFYLSKCPESVKTRNDVFYLMPERSCVPDSPVWYSTQALGREPLSKMLHRVKMVKEINIALLTS